MYQVSYLPGWVFMGLELIQNPASLMNSKSCPIKLQY